MYRHGIVKILVEFHLQNIGDNWEGFLVRNHFQEDTHEQPNSSRTKRGRKIKIDRTMEQELQQSQELSQDGIPLADILEKINKRDIRRKKASKQIDI